MHLLASVGLAFAVATAPPSFDHSALDALLHQNVRGGLVDYDAFAAAPAFKAYLERLAAFDPEGLPATDRLAFWINAYNAYTIALIVRHGERESIRNINRTFGFQGRGPWREKLAVVGGTAYTLDFIEHDIIRARFREPRIHFALVCAALGCPPLRGEAYRGDLLDRQLDEQARLFLLGSPDKNRVDIPAGRLYLSRIFDWYREDFGSSDAAIGAYVARFYPAGDVRDFLERGRFALRYTTYDWRLNRRSAKAPDGN